MKKAMQLLFLTFIFLLFRLLSFTQIPNFSGTWVLNFEKSKLEDKNEKLTGQKFIIEQKGDMFRLKIYHIYGSKIKRIGFKMLVDGKTRKVKLIFKGRLEQKGNSLQATMWRKNYLNRVNYRFGVNENEFIADEQFTGRPKNHHSIWVFERQL